MLKKGDFYFYQNLCQEKTCLDKLDNQADFENLAKRTTNKTEATKQSQSKPLRTEAQAENLEADFSDSTKPTRNYASGKSAAKRKRRELENLLAEKILTKTAYLKNTTAKKVLNFYANHKSKPCESDMVLHLLFGAASQRFALPALGRAAERRPTGKMLRRGKMLGIAPESPASGARFVGQFVLRKTQ